MVPLLGPKPAPTDPALVLEKVLPLAHGSSRRAGDEREPPRSHRHSSESAQSRLAIPSRSRLGSRFGPTPNPAESRPPAHPLSVEPKLKRPGLF